MHGLFQIQQTQALRAKPQVEEGIEERIEATVDIRQACGIWMSQKQKMEEPAGVRRQVQVGQRIHALQHMERRPAESEDHY